mgnify:CR=1 FL=1
MSKKRRRAKRNAGARQLQEYLDTGGDGATAALLAEQCGMLPAQLCHLAKSRRIPTLPQAAALEQIAGIPPKAWLQAS